MPKFQNSGCADAACAMEIGIGWNGEECTWFSGCGTVDEDGVDHAGSLGWLPYHLSYTSTWQSNVVAHCCYHPKL